MANDVLGNPYVLDTAGSAVAVGSQLKILRMTFYAAVAGDDIDVANGAGRSFWKIRAVSAAANFEDYAGVHFELIEPFIVDGLSITTIDGGELWVWLK